jgi:hypothetical protein
VGSSRSLRHGQGTQRFVSRHDGRGSLATMRVGVAVRVMPRGITFHLVRAQHSADGNIRPHTSVS